LPTRRIFGHEDHEGTKITKKNSFHVFSFSSSIAHSLPLWTRRSRRHENHGKNSLLFFFVFFVIFVFFVVAFSWG